jgi:hypothetical protein
LRNKNEKKTFDNMFSIANLYNSASSNAVIPIRIYPIMMSIIFHDYKTLTEKLSTPFIGEIEHLKILILTSIIITTILPF